MYTDMVVDRNMDNMDMCPDTDMDTETDIEMHMWTATDIDTGMAMDIDTDLGIDTFTQATHPTLAIRTMHAAMHACPKGLSL